MTEEQMQELNRQLRQMVESQNNAPLDDFAGLSSTQIHSLLRRPLGAGSVVQWARRADFDVEEVPILRLALAITQKLEHKEIKLTAKGNLPRAVVRELWEMDVELSDPKYQTKINSMDEWPLCVCLLVSLKKSKVVKVRSGKLSLTARGKKLLPHSFELFKAMFTATFQKFSLIYAAWMPEKAEVVQQFTGFVLYLWLSNGKEWKEINWYGSRTVTAFPAAIGEGLDRSEFTSTFKTIYFARLFPWYGLVRVRGDYDYKSDAREVMATDLYRNLFQLELESRAAPVDNPDAQISSALFDAEMGGVSWTSNEIDPAVQEAFHDSIRAFHADDSPGGVTIGSLMTDLELPDPDTVTNRKASITLINDLLRTMSERHVYFPPPPQLPPSVLYRFILTDLFAHKIPPPSEQLPAYVPFESVETELRLFTEEVTAAEAFLLAMFQLDRPLDTNMFSPTMRLKGEVVPREKAIAHANKWRAKHKSIVPMSFAPGPAQEGADGVKFQFVDVAYQITHLNGRIEDLEGPGVIQLSPSKEGWLVQGGTFEGFEF